MQRRALEAQAAEGPAGASRTENVKLSAKTRPDILGQVRSGIRGNEGTSQRGASQHDALENQRHVVARLICAMKFDDVRMALEDAQDLDFALDVFDRLPVFHIRLVDPLGSILHLGRDLRAPARWVAPAGGRTSARPREGRKGDERSPRSREMGERETK